MAMKPTMYPGIKKLSVDQPKDDGIDISDGADQEHVRSAKSYD
jgi:hypothetical protein